MPKRIQLSRKKGWRKPENTVVVARNTKWGNPFRIGDNIPGFRNEPMDRADACRAFALFTLPHLPVEELCGKDLACWCPLNQPCHADILLKHANPQPFQPFKRPK
ncbi:DUF4326 domain-containing protein [Roseibium sediminis]|uniref:DUF4326 domain-containing protein n=1 Tax=Roseibium sediminis TaxID=1775174 RepID=UPI00123E0EAB|nr:DUF4326 domain-containing protein [Roseibium sediminis]